MTNKTQQKKNCPILVADGLEQQEFNPIPKQPFEAEGASKLMFFALMTSRVQALDIIFDKGDLLPFMCRFPMPPLSALARFTVCPVVTRRRCESGSAQNSRKSG